MDESKWDDVLNAKNRHRRDVLKNWLNFVKNLQRPLVFFCLNLEPYKQKFE